MYEDLAGHFDYAEENGIATITLGRPERRNALTPDDYRGLRDLSTTLKTRDDLSVLVFKGSEGAFCAGGDLDLTAAALLNKGARAQHDFMRITGELTRNLREMPAVVVAAIDGVAAGAGAAIALAADFRVLSTRASLAFVFTKIGLAGGDMGTAWLLQRQIGLSAATEILMLGNPVSAEQAQALNLAHRVVSPEGMAECLAQLTAELKDRSARGLAMTKQILNRTASVDYATGLDMETWTQSLLMAGPEFTGFLQNWVDRPRRK